MFFDNPFNLFDPLAFLFKSLDGDEMFLVFELVFKGKRILVFFFCVLVTIRKGKERKREREKERKREREKERSPSVSAK